MKKMTTTLTVLALTATLAQTARAGDCEWATAGKVLTGVIAGAAIVHALQPQPTCVYTAPPVVYAPAPVVVAAPAPAPVMVAPAPVVYAPRPVVVCAPRVYVRPPPVVNVHFGGGPRHHHFRSHCCW